MFVPRQAVETIHQYQPRLLLRQPLQPLFMKPVLEEYKSEGRKVENNLGYMRVMIRLSRSRKRNHDMLPTLRQRSISQLSRSANYHLRGSPRISRWKMEWHVLERRKVAKQGESRAMAKDGEGWVSVSVKCEVCVRVRACA